MSPLLSDFRKGYSSQHALLHMLETWHKWLDKKKVVGALLMDLSKAFDCVNHNLLIAKLHAYGFSDSALRLIKSYLSDRFQRVGVDGSYSSWRELLTGIPQGSILGPLLFNIYLNDLMFLFQESEVEICNYADDNTLFTSGKTLSDVKVSLEGAYVKISDWFSNNGLQLNAEKCKLLILGKPNSEENASLDLKGTSLPESQSVKLLGIVLDNKLSYTEHVTKLCKKANAKTYALRRLSPFISDFKRQILANSFIFCNFNYCPLVWGFSSRCLLHKIDRTQEKAAKLLSQETSGIYRNSIHERNCRLLLQEVFKTKHGLNPSYMNDVFTFKKSQYNLRSSCALEREKIRSVRHGLQTVSYIAAQLWDTLPESAKQVSSLATFRSALKDIPEINCRCRLCATYIPSLGFVD